MGAGDHFVVDDWSWDRNCNYDYVRTGQLLPQRIKYVSIKMSAAEYSIYL